MSHSYFLPVFQQRFLSRLSFLLGTLFLFACEYQTDEMYYKEIARPDFSGITIDLAEISNDTIYISGIATLKFDALFSGKRPGNAYAYLGDELVLTSSTGLQDMVIDPQYISSGIYKLHLQITVASGTGSIADIHNLETKVITREWTVIIDHDMPEKIEITSIAKEDGSLFIYWQSYTKWNFDHYTLQKYCYNEFYQYFEHCWTKEITDAATTALHDESFIGGKARYILTVTAASKTSEADEEIIDFLYNPALEYEWTTDKKILIKWNRPEFFSNLSDYTITFPDDNDTRSFYIQNVNDTTLEIDPLISFPAFKRIMVTAHPKGANSSAYGNRYADSMIFLGKIFPWFEREMIAYHAGLNAYFAIGYHENERSLIRINSETYEIEQSIPCQNGTFALSKNGQHLYLADNGKLLELNPSDFSEISSIDLQADFSTTYKFMAVSNNKRLIIDNRIFDLNAGTLLQTMPTTLYSISPNGNFVFGFGSLYRHNGSNFEKVVAFGTLGSWGEFLNDDTFISFGASTIDVYDLVSMSNANSITHNGSNFHIDPKTGMIGGFTDDFQQGPKNFYIYSTSGLQKEIPIANISSQYTIMLLLNDHLVTSGGGSIIPASWYE